MLIVVGLTSALLAPTAARATTRFTDVPTTYWDYSQIMSEAQWMSDYGSTLFYPSTHENRNYLARTLVQIYAPHQAVDSSITFSDITTTDPFYRYANVAVKNGWLQKYSSNRWAGGSSVPRNLFDQALVLAMGTMTSEIAGLQSIHMTNGTVYPVSTRWPYTQLGIYLGLHYDHTDDSLDMQATTNIKRDEVAYSLWAAKNIPSWLVIDAAKFNSVELPSLDPTIAGQAVQQQITQYALNQVGYPYIWGGEWNAKSPTGYCCGTQSQGGFDCSGFVWWVLKKYEDGYNAAQYRPYPGWSDHDRTSTGMAQNTTTKLTYAQLAIGNVMMFASDGGTNYTDVDHVGIYIGNNWMMHSTSGGPQLQWVGDGWYHDYFVWGRGLKSSSAMPAGGAPPSAGDGALAIDASR